MFCEKFRETPKKPILLFFFFILDITLDFYDEDGRNRKATNDYPIDPPIIHRNHSVAVFVYVHERGREEILRSSEHSGFAKFTTGLSGVVLTPRMAKTVNRLSLS